MLGQYEAALIDANKALDVKPVLPVAYVNRGNAFAYLNRFSEALADLDKAIGLEPNHADWYRDRSTTHGKLKQFQKALADINKAIELEPRNGVFYRDRGIFWIERNKLQLAIPDLSKAIELGGPEVSRAHASRGDAYARLRQFDRAAADFDKALQLGLADKALRAKTHVGLATCFRIAGNFRQAIAQYTSAINLHDKEKLKCADNCECHAAAYDQRGYCYNELKEFPKAIADVSKAIELDPTEFLPYYNRGACYERLRQYDRAIADYAKASDLAPDRSEPALELIILLFECPQRDLRDLPRGIALAEAAVKKWKPDRAIWSRLGKARYKVGRWTAALEALEAAHKLRKTPKEGISDLFYQAMARWQLGDKKTAANEYADAVAAMNVHAPNRPDLRDLKAKAAALLGIKTPPPIKASEPTDRPDVKRTTPLT